MTTSATKSISVSQVETEIVRHIDAERLSTGMMLPGFNELARRIGAAPGTVQRAVANLALKGVLRSEKRRGTFVARGVETVSAPSGRATSAAYTGAGYAPIRTQNRVSVAEELSERGGISSSPRSGTFAPTLVKPSRFIILAGVTPYRELPTSNELWSRRASSSFERYVQAQGHSTHTVNLMDRPAEEAADEIDEAVAAGADMIVYIEGSDPPHGEACLQKRLALILKKYAREHLSLIQVRWSGDMPLPADTVSFNGDHGSYLATQYLLDLGHRDIVFMSSHLAVSDSYHDWTIRRITAFYNALYHAGQEWEGPLRDPGNPEAWDKVVFADAVEVGQEMWFDSGHSAWRKLVERVPPPDAIVAINDQFAYSVVEEARAAGYDVPGQLSVIGYDDRYCSAAINLTTIHVPVEDMGIEAARLALSRLAEPIRGAHTELYLSPTLVVRGTTRRKK